MSRPRQSLVRIYVAEYHELVTLLRSTPDRSLPRVNLLAWSRLFVKPDADCLGIPYLPPDLDLVNERPASHHVGFWGGTKPEPEVICSNVSVIFLLSHTNLFVFHLICDIEKMTPNGASRALFALPTILSYPMYCILCPSTLCSMPCQVLPRSCNTLL